MEKPTVVQGDRTNGYVPGYIEWWEHELAWQDYSKQYHGQSAERIAERGGFSWWELCDHLGHPPTTWTKR